MKREELGLRLGLRPEQLLSRAEAAAAIGVGAHTLRASPGSYPGFYAVDSGETLYDPRVVENFKAWRSAGRPKPPTDLPDPFKLARAGGGRLPDPPLRRVANAALATMMVERWKTSEIARRWDLTLNDLKASDRLYAADFAKHRPERSTKLGQPDLLTFFFKSHWQNESLPPKNIDAIIHQAWMTVLREHEYALGLAKVSDGLSRSDE